MCFIVNLLLLPMRISCIVLCLALCVSDSQALQSFVAVTSMGKDFYSNGKYIFKFLRSVGYFCEGGLQLAKRLQFRYEPVEKQKSHVNDYVAF